MRLVNVFVVYDVIVAVEDNESNEGAIGAVIDLIRAAEDPEPPSETNALPVARAQSIREAWQSKRPIVAADVTDADFERLKGKTCAEVFAMLHTKEGKDAEATATAAKAKK